VPDRKQPIFLITAKHIPCFNNAVGQDESAHKMLFLSEP